MKTSMSRRSLLTTATIATTAIATTGLAACQSGGDAPGGEGSSGVTPPDRVVARPSFTAYAGVEPTLPPLDNGTSAFFDSYPDDPATFLSSAPGDGRKISGFAILNNALIPVERNQFWQNVNATLGVELDITGALVGDYPNKFMTIVAGNEAPDIACVLPTLTPKLGDLLNARFADLTEHLSGDAVKDYPGLANIPTSAWTRSIYNNKLFLIPSPRYMLYRVPVVRADIAEKFGVDPYFTDGASLSAMLEAFSDRKKNQFATITATGLLDTVAEMMGVPNQWAIVDGKWVKDYETDEFAAALDFVAQAWKKEQIHPDAFDPNFATTASNLYASGKSPLFPTVPNFAGHAGNALQQDPNARTVPVPLKQFEDGSQPCKRWLGAGTPYYLGLGANTDVEQSLKVVDALAAPFGTKEFLAFKYGIQGTHFEMDNGTPVTNELWDTERLGAMIYLGAPALVHFGANSEVMRTEYEAEAEALDHAISQPQLDFVSETDLDQGSALKTQIDDSINGIIQGRKTMAEWPDAVAEWRRVGGDTIRNEYQAAYDAG